jgi:hypothetical protein
MYNYKYNYGTITITSYNKVLHLLRSIYCYLYSHIANDLVANFKKTLKVKKRRANNKSWSTAVYAALLKLSKKKYILDTINSTISNNIINSTTRRLILVLVVTMHLTERSKMRYSYHIIISYVLSWRAKYNKPQRKSAQAKIAVQVPSTSKLAKHSNRIC